MYYTRSIGEISETAFELSNKSLMQPGHQPNKILVAYAKLIENISQGRSTNFNKAPYIQLFISTH